MGDLDTLYAPEAAPPAAAPRPRAPKAPAAPAPTDEAFQAILKDPSTLPSIKGAGFTPEQDKAFRTAWPMTNLPSKPEAADKAAGLNGDLDRIHESAVKVFAQPKVDKRAATAVEDYYKWLRTEGKPEGGGEASAKLIGFLTPTKHDPIDELRGPARQQAIDMRNLVDHIKSARETTGAHEDELHILTSLLPSPGDKPEQVAQKRTAFANQLEELAQGLPPQFWRAAAKHIVRARALRGDDAAAVPRGTAPGAPGAPPGAAVAAGLADEEDPTAGFVKRALVTGATGLALPALAAIRAAISSGGETPFVKGAAANPGKPGSVDFSDEVKNLKDIRAQRLGMADSAAADEQEEADKEAHPVLSRVAGFGGGLLDPTNVLLGIPGKAIEGGKAALEAGESLTPVAKSFMSKALDMAHPFVKTAIAHALPGAGAGALAAAGAGGGGGDIAKGAGLGALIGTALGKGAEKFLATPGSNAAIGDVVGKEAAALKLEPAQVAARKAALEADTFGNKSATAAALGNKTAQAELGPKLVQWKNELFAKYKVQPQSHFATLFNAIEDATAAGDTKLAGELRAKFDGIPESRLHPDLKRDAGKLLNLRAVGGAAAAEHTGAGPSSVARPEAAFEQNPTAGGAARLGTMAAGGNRFAIRALAAGAGRAVLNPIAEPIQQSLARLYLAKQQGNISAVQALAQHLIETGVPMSAIQQVIGGGQPQ